MSHHCQLREDSTLVAKSITKEIGRLYRCLMSVSAACLFRVKECGQYCGADTSLMIDSINERIFLKRDAGYSKSRSSAALNLVNRMLGSFPSSLQPVNPAIFKAFLSSSAVKKEDTIDYEDKCITSKPASPHINKRVEWFKMPGLEIPGRTFSLARDDLEAASSIL